MKEGNEVATGSGAWLGIDELDAGFRQAPEVFADVWAAVGDVMQAGSMAFEKAADSSIGTEGLDELQLSAEGDTDTLAGDGFRLGASVPGEQLVQTCCLIERRHGDRHVVQWPTVR